MEEGPWPPEKHEVELHRLQDRLLACFDAVVGGHLAAQFPESDRSDVNIRLDCYNLERCLITPIFEAVRQYVDEQPDCRAAVDTSPHVKTVLLELNLREYVVDR